MEPIIADHVNGDSIDMSLASSYLPALLSLLKTVMLLAALTIMQKLGMDIDQAVIVCGACVYLDRCLCIYYIMDTNASALCVLLSVTEKSF